MVAVYKNEERSPWRKDHKAEVASAVVKTLSCLSALFCLRLERANGPSVTYLGSPSALSATNLAKVSGVKPPAAITALLFSMDYLLPTSGTPIIRSRGRIYLLSMTDGLRNLSRCYLVDCSEIF